MPVGVEVHGLMGRILGVSPEHKSSTKPSSWEMEGSTLRVAITQTWIEVGPDAAGFAAGRAGANAGATGDVIIGITLACAGRFRLQQSGGYWVEASVWSRIRF
jgi:hypothetical protein